MPMDSFGATFAPTAEAAMNGPREGGIAGVPQAIQILSLALPRILGASRLADRSLFTGMGGQGQDPAAAAALQSLLRAVQGHMMPAPQSPFPPNTGNGGSDSGYGGGGSSSGDGKPRVVTQDVPPGPRIPIRRGPKEA